MNGFRLRAFLLCFIGFALYSNTLFHDYALDDGLVIRENRYTKQGFAGIKDILIHDSFAGNIKLGSNELTGGRYRPLSLVTYAIEWQFFGQSPHISHFINVLLYCLTGFLLFWFLYHYLSEKNKDVAFLTAF